MRTPSPTGINERRKSSEPLPSFADQTFFRFIVCLNFSNSAGGSSSTVSGGLYNSTAPGATFASVAGGMYNTATGTSSSVSGGKVNTASGSYSSVSGGESRSAVGSGDWVAGSLFEDD